MPSVVLGTGCSLWEMGEHSLWRASDWTLLVGQFALQDWCGGTAAIRGRPLTRFCSSCGCEMAQKPRQPIHRTRFFTFAKLPPRVQKALQLAQYGPWRRFLGRLACLISSNFVAFGKAAASERERRTHRVVALSVRLEQALNALRPIGAAPAPDLEASKPAHLQTRRPPRAKHERRRSPDRAPSGPGVGQLPAETTKLLSRTPRLEGTRR